MERLARVPRLQARPLGLPVWSSLDWRAAATAAAAALLLFRCKRGVLEVLAVSAFAGLVLTKL